MKVFSQLILLAVFTACLSGCPSETSPQESPASESHTESHSESSAPASPAAVNLVGDPAKGPALIASKTCGTCHTIKSIPTAKGTIGPTLDGIASTAATRVSGLDAEAYLRQSIEQPQAFVVPKFQPMMPALRTTLSDQEYADLIAYLLTLKS